MSKIVKAMSKNLKIKNSEKRTALLPRRHSAPNSTSSESLLRSRIHLRSEDDTLSIEGGSPGLAIWIEKNGDVLEDTDDDSPETLSKTLKLKVGSSSGGDKFAGTDYFDTGRVSIGSVVTGERNSLENSNVTADTKYKILKELGEGSYGKVFLVQGADNDGVKYAMKEFKMLRKEIECTKIQTAKALTEASILSRLEHDHIVKHIDVFLSRGRFFLVMEYAVEGDLYQHIERKEEEGRTWSKKFIVRWFSQMVSGLAYLHSNNIMHRDIKPQNILVAKDLVLKFADFGLARQMDGSELYANTECGTKLYLSPEAVLHEQYTYSCDVWALGCVLFQLCMLKKAFSTLGEIVKGKIPRISDDITDENTEDLCILGSKMLQRRARKRISCEDLHDICEAAKAANSTILSVRATSETPQVLGPLVSQSLSSHTSSKYGSNVKEEYERQAVMIIQDHRKDSQQSRFSLDISHLDSDYSGDSRLSRGSKQGVVLPSFCGFHAHWIHTSQNLKIYIQCRENNHFPHPENQNGQSEN